MDKGQIITLVFIVLILLFLLNHISVTTTSTPTTTKTKTATVIYKQPTTTTIYTSGKYNPYKAQYYN